MCTDNKIGDEGAIVLGEALKDNSTLTQLNLYGMKQFESFVIHVKHIESDTICLQGMVLVRK